MTKHHKIYVLTALFSFLLIGLIFLSILKVNPLELLNNLLQTSYKPHYNFIHYGKVGHWPVNLFSLTIIGLTAIILLIQNRWLHRRKPNLHQDLPFSTFLLISLFTFFPLWLGVQSYAQLNVWKTNYLHMAGKTHFEKFRGTNMGKSLNMANFCLAHLDNHQRTAELATDLDLSRDPGMIMHRCLAFYLYPVDLRHVRAEETDTWIAFEKTDARKHVPAGYKVIAELDSANLIAIKDN